MQLSISIYLGYLSTVKCTVAAKIKFPQQSEKVAKKSLRLKNRFRLRMT